MLRNLKQSINRISKNTVVCNRTIYKAMMLLAQQGNKKYDSRS